MKSAAPAGGDHPPVNYKVLIMGDRLFIRSKHIAPPLILGQERVLQTKNNSIPFKRANTKTLSIPRGTSQIEFDYVSQGKLPDLVILAMVSDTAIGAAYQARPYHFQNFAASYLCMQANGEQIHR